MDRWQSVLRREFAETGSLEDKHAVGDDEESVRAALGHRREDVVELSGLARLEKV